MLENCAYCFFLLSDYTQIWFSFIEQKAEVKTTCCFTVSVCVGKRGRGEGGGTVLGGITKLPTFVTIVIVALQKLNFK